MQTEEDIFDVSEVVVEPFNMKEWLRDTFSGFKTSVSSKFIWLSCLFLPWYVWCVTFYSEPLLWCMITAASLLLLAITALRPRSVLYWMAPCLLLFNTTYFWLPWPGIKMSYIVPAAICFGFLLNFVINGAEQNDEHFVSFDFKIFIICLISAGMIGLLSFFDWTEPSAWHELLQQLRLIPILSEKEKYVPLRYMWVWLLAISVYSILRRIVRNLKDVRTLFWSLQFTSIPIAAFGLYSYMTKQYMVAHYIYERRINATLSSPAVLADIFMVIFVTGIYLLRESKLLIVRIFLIFALFTQIVIIFLSGCRTNFILIALYLLILGAINFRKFIRKTKWYVTLSIVIIFAMMVFGGLHIAVKVKQTKISKLPVIKRLTEWRSEYTHGYSFKKVFLKGRFNHWLAAGNMIKENPVWGVGCGLFEQKYKTYHDKTDLFWYARAHCVPLRICAEGGLVTFVIFLIFLSLMIIRLAYGFTRRARKKEPKWSKLTRTMAIIFLMIFISSFFTDIFYENSESIIFLSILSVCGALGNKHTSRFFRQHFLFLKRKIVNIEYDLNMFFVGIGWEYLGFIKIKSIIKILVLFVLTAIILIGISNTSIKRRKLFSEGKLSYGFLNNYKKQWYVIGGHAMTGFIVNRSAFSFSYKSFNVKMAQLGQFLDVYINNVLIGSLPLNSISEQVIYCDISDFSGDKVNIDFKVDHTFVPLKEKWFVDSHKYGAVITKPKQTGDNLTVIRKEVNKNPKIKWITNPDFQKQDK